MPSVQPSRTLTVAIDRPPDVVQAFVSTPENLPRWATSFCRSIAPQGDRWVAETNLGTITIRFGPPNDLGVADHFVTVAPGSEVLVPIRVIPNARGSEVVFTLFRGETMTEEEFARDAAMIERDLATLRAVLEGAAGGMAGPV